MVTASSAVSFTGSTQPARVNATTQVRTRRGTGQGLSKRRGSRKTSGRSLLPRTGEGIRTPGAVAGAGVGATLTYPRALNLLVSVVGAAHQRPTLDVFEAALQPFSLQPRKLV